MKILPLPDTVVCPDADFDQYVVVSDDHCMVLNDKPECFNACEAWIDMFFFNREVDEVADIYDVHERLDGAFDVAELMYDGTTRMVTKSYDPLGQHPDVSDRIMGGIVDGHHLDQLVYVTDDSAGRLKLVIVDSGETDEGNGSFTWAHYVKGVCDYLDSSFQFYLVYEDDLGRTSEMLLANDDPRIVKCSYIISLNGDIPF